MELKCKDAIMTAEGRATDLLSRMTLEEKLQQMRMINPINTLLDDGRYYEPLLRERIGQGIGICCSTSYFPPELINRIQRFAVEETRLGIPFIFATEAIHGVMSMGATVFPQAIGLGATWNTELMAEVAGTIGREARTLGFTQVLAPDLDLSRDPRWGRVEENYGEDPFLTARLGVAYVKALQGQGVAATLKHYVAHGSPEAGINLSPVHVGERELRETMLEPFASAIAEAGAMSVMPAYSELDGVPLHASRFLLTHLLREELGFDGFTVSDFGAIKMLHSFHRTATGALEAGKQALYAGVDLEAPDVYGYSRDFGEAAKQNCIIMEWIDRAVERILRVKFRLGLFEDPYAKIGLIGGVHDAAAMQLARKAAHESFVLLKNDAKVLPLPASVGKVALIGPNTRIPQLGDYTHRTAANTAISLLQAFTERIGADRIRYAMGCTISSGTDKGIAEAVETAKAADTAILVLGDNSSFFGGISWGDESLDTTVTCGEGFDQSDLNLPGRQQELLEAVAATGTPVILILMTGRPYCIRWAKAHIPVILQAWYPGEQGGYALCDILFGDVNPSGKLPVSFPQSEGHIPCFYNHKISARGYYKRPGIPEKPGRDYVFSSPEPLYPFGYGLSYTSFAYNDLSISPLRAGIDDTVEVSVKVINTGVCEGKEVVQLFLTDCFSRITPFVKRLRGFEKISLLPGESRQVRFTLDGRDFAFINEAMKSEIEPGEFMVSVGGLQASFYIGATEDSQI